MNTLEPMPHRATQKERVLEILKRNGRISNYEAIDMYPRITRLAAIIGFLEKDGVQVYGKRDPMNKKCYWYTLIAYPDETGQMRIA